MQTRGLGGRRRKAGGRPTQQETWMIDACLQQGGKQTKTKAMLDSPFVPPLRSLLLILLLSALLSFTFLFHLLPFDCRVTSLPCVCFPVWSLWCVCVCARVVTLCCPLSVDVPGKTPARPPSLLLFPFLLSRRLTIDPTLCAWACDLPSPLLLESREGLHVARRGVGLCVYASAHTPPFFSYIAAPPHAPMSSSKTQHTVKAESNVCVSAFKAAMRWRWHPSPFRLAFTAAFTPEAPQGGEASCLPCISVSLACLS